MTVQEIQDRTSKDLYQFQKDYPDYDLYYEELVKVMQTDSFTVAKHATPYDVLVAAYKHVTSDTLDNYE